MSKNFNNKQLLRVTNVINHHALQALGHVNAIRLYTQPSQHSSSTEYTRNQINLQLHYIQHFSNAIIAATMHHMHSSQL
jgi:hypothetical protein